MAQVRIESDIDEMIACAAREVAMRRAVYPKQIAAGKMSSEQSAKEIRVMEDIVRTLNVLKSNAMTGVVKEFTPIKERR